MEFAGKSVLVTGAGRGIGAVIARGFAQRGARVAIADIDRKAAENTAQEIRAEGAEALGVQVDIADEEALIAACSQIEKTLAPIDILINNAGILHTEKVQDISAEAWDRSMAINVKGAFLCCRTLLPAMQERRSGTIVNISSLAGQAGGILVGADYAASKAALLGMTKKMAREYAASGIRVNAVAPGTTRTPMLDAMQEDELRSLTAQIPMGRCGEPEEIAEAVYFLASDRASFITGHTLDVNGGLLMR